GGGHATGPVLAHADAVSAARAGDDIRAFDGGEHKGGAGQTAEDAPNGKLLTDFRSFRGAGDSNRFEPAARAAFTQFDSAHRANAIVTICHATEVGHGNPFLPAVAFPVRAAVGGRRVGEPFGESVGRGRVARVALGNVAYGAEGFVGR